jgi:hypothetical protein
VNQYTPDPPTARISAGTAVKIGFFGALGVLLFSVVMTAIGIIGAVVLTAVGVSVVEFLPAR